VQVQCSCKLTSLKVKAGVVPDFVFVRTPDLKTFRNDTGVSVRATLHFAFNMGVLIITSISSINRICHYMLYGETEIYGLPVI